MISPLSKRLYESIGNYLNKKILNLDEMTNKEKIKIINKLYPIEFFFEDKLNSKHNFVCPFHKDRSPSAHFYKESNSIWCFTCKKFFYPINFINKNRLKLDDIWEELVFLYKTEDFSNIELNNEIKKEKKETFFSKPNKDLISFSKEYFENLNNLNKE